jgi:outer membrane protein assembly factor BamD (BamD/ComL family)
MTALALALCMACAHQAPPKRAAHKPKPVSAEARTEADRLYYEGVEDYVSGDLDTAISTFHQVLKLDPKHKNARVSLKRAQDEANALKARAQ